MLDMLFLLAILGMLITRKQYTTQEVEKRSKKGTKRVVPIVHPGAGSSVLIIGLLFVVVGNLFNVIRMQQNRKNQEG